MRAVTDLPHTEQVVLLYQDLRLRTAGRMGTLREIQREAGIPTMSSSRAMKRLEAEGLIERERHGWHTGRMTRMGEAAAEWLGWMGIREKQRAAARAGEDAQETIHPTRRRHPFQGPVLRRDRQDGSKIGRTVTKGHWRGMPLYYLTLEERATCPRSCQQWRSCYGNNMPRAYRYRHGAELEAALIGEVAALAEQYSDGFVVRLHMLGDFYSAHYVGLWGRLLAEYPALHVFGYTAHKRNSTLGRIIESWCREYGRRFSIRFSGEDGPMGAMVGEGDEDVAGFWCPQQTGATANCGSCGACWSTDRPVWFRRH